MNIKELMGKHSTRDKILFAAKDLFSTRGFESVKTRDIARHAGVSLGSLAYYFKTKDTLALETINTIIERAWSYLEKEHNLCKNLETMQKKEQIRLLKSILYKYVDIIYSGEISNEFVVLMIREQQRTDSIYGNLYRSKISVFYDILKQLLASILVTKPNDDTVVIALTGIVGQILSFKMIEKSALQRIPNTAYSARETAEIKKFLYRQIYQMLQRFETGLKNKSITPI